MRFRSFYAFVIFLMRMKFSITFATMHDEQIFFSLHFKKEKPKPMLIY